MKKCILLILVFQTLALGAFANELILAPLPADDLLRVVSEKLNSEWALKNKSLCGMTKAKSFQVTKTESDISESLKKLLIDSYGPKIDPKIEIKIESKNIEEFDMAVIINSLMESKNDEVDSDDIKMAYAKNLQQLLNKLEVNRNTTIYIAEAKNDSCHPGQKIRSFFVYRAESEKAFQVFTAQGAF
jgi:hypothetical protein